MNSEPTEGAGMIEALAWLEVNKKRLAWGAVIAVVAGFGIYVWNYMAEQKEVNASAALIRLKTSVNSQTNQSPASASEFLKVAQDNPGTAAAERALLLGATASFTEGKYADAQTEFNKLIQEHPGSQWVSEAAYGVASSLEAQGKQDEAVTSYQRVITSYGNEPVANEARMALARIYEAKKQPDLALKQYDELTKPGSMSGMSRVTQDAMIRKDKLLKKYPNLKPVVTNTAVMSAPGVMMGSNAPALKLSTNGPAPSTTTNKPAGK
jgi:predicted negative regulator of RcsB-dependent stress response